MFQMLRIAAVAALGLVAASCDATTGLAPSSFDGQWVVRTQANASCFGVAGGADRHFTIVDAKTGFGGGVFNVVEDWDFVRPYRGYGWIVTGNFNLSDRTVELNFWHTPLAVGAVFVGTIEPDGSLVGTVRDPKPGYSPHTVIGACVFQATGFKAR